MNHVGNYDDPALPPSFPDTRTIKAMTTVDLAARWNLSGRFEGSAATLGVINLTNEIPPFVRSAGTNGYDYGQHDIRGRMVYLSLNAKF